MDSFILFCQLSKVEVEIHRWFIHLSFTYSLIYSSLIHSFCSFHSQKLDLRFETIVSSYFNENPSFSNVCYHSSCISIGFPAFSKDFPSISTKSRVFSLVFKHFSFISNEFPTDFPCPPSPHHPSEASCTPMHPHAPSNLSIPAQRGGGGGGDIRMHLTHPPKKLRRRFFFRIVNSISRLGCRKAAIPPNSNFFLGHLYRQERPHNKNALRAGSW